MSQRAVAAGALMPPLQLAVDAHDLARDRRGIGTYARALLGRFAQRDDVELTLLVRDWLPARFATALRAALGATGAQRLRYANRVPRDADAVWHPWNGTFFNSEVPAVATIHDLIPFVFPAAEAALRESQQAPIRRTAATARTVICDSHCTAHDVERYLDVPAERLQRVALGVDAIFSPGGLAALPASLRERAYVLYVGAHDPHKNVATLVAAHRAAFPHGDVALVFTRPSSLAPEAIVCDNVPSATLVALYRGAALVAVPSLYEGFGLPLLEALACGAPVLAAHTAALPEVGGAAVAYVEAARDTGAWQHALLDLFANPQRRQTLASLGPAQAAKFSWERCAEETLAILRATAAGTPQPGLH